MQYKEQYISVLLILGIHSKFDFDKINTSTTANLCTQTIDIDI